MTDAERLTWLAKAISESSFAGRTIRWRAARISGDWRESMTDDDWLLAIRESVDEAVRLESEETDE